MAEKLTKESLKEIIFQAFKDVPKGNSLGARECIAEDDYASEEEKREAKKLDVEQHWWEYPKELVESGTLDYSLTYNNDDGVKFHLPALMTAEIYGFGNTAGNYTLTLDDVIAIKDEEHRLVRDWFKAGGVDEKNYVIEK